MGKGKQSKHDRKESRKEGRDNVKRDAKQLKAPSRKVKAKGGISKIEMTSEGEEMLLRLITMLDSGDLEVNLASALPIITEDSDDNDDSSSDGTNDEQDVISDQDDSDDSDDEDDDDEDDFSKDMKKITVAPLSVSKNNVIFTDKQRRSLVRKLIRDDRRVSIELANRLAEQKVSRNLVAKAKMINEKSKQKGDVASEHISIDFNDSVPPQYFSQTTPVSSILRLNISCGSKSGGRVAGGMSKLILTDRTEPLNRLLEIARNKFAAPKKFSQLVILPDGVLLDADGLFLLPDGAQLLLVVGDIGKDAAHRVKTAPVVVDSEVPSTDSDIILKEVDTVSDSESGAPTPVDNYWCPPERSHVIEAQRTPRSIGDYVESNNMREKQIKMFGDPSYKAINTGRSGLPIHKVREELLEVIRENQFVVVSGETGSGKTTQLPAYLLEDLIDRGLGSEGYIICTQPRRIAAITVAERVAFERQESVGKTVGYSVRLNSRVSSSTRILYCTTGVLLRRLQHPDFLASVSHIVVDEVHERQVETDFLMTLLKENAPNYPHLRLVMMSATMQEGLFSEYFKCPIIYVKGRCFNVEQHYMKDINKLVAIQQRAVALERGKESSENWDKERAGVRKSSAMKLSLPNELANYERPPRFDAEIVAETIIRIIQTYSKRDRTSSFQAITPPNPLETGDAILVFLSGIQQITKVSRALRQRNMTSLSAQVHMLHGSLQPEVQRRIFKKTKPGEWKIVLSTNIAETSVTVEDVTHVIDCGMVKELRYDAVANMSSLQEVFVSRASARQRAGRAGRVRPGHCWRLFSKEFLESTLVEDNPAPEIRRVPLEEVVLQVLLLKLGLPDSFLSKCLEPPSMEQIRTSVTCLLDIKAILPKANLPLTALGYHLAQMPVDVRIGKMLITASLLNCIEPALTIAATLAGKSPFMTPPNNREEAAKSHNSFTSSYNYALTAEKYSITIPTQPDGKLQKNGKFQEDLTPPNDVFFSDHLASVNAYNLWEKIFNQHGKDAAFTFCREKYLSNSCLSEIMRLRESFKQYLRNAGFLPSLARTGDEDEDDDDDERNADYDSKVKSSGGMIDNIFNKASSSDNTSQSALRSDNSGYGIMRCALCAGLSPQIVRVSRFEDQAQKTQRKGASGRRFQVPLHIMQGDGVEVHVHPSSLTHSYVKYLLEGGQGSGQGQSQRSKDAYIVYHKKVASTKVYLHDCTVVPAAAILLFGGDILISRTRKGSSSEVGVLVTVGSWIHFKMNELHAVLFRRLQGEIESLLRIKVEDAANDVTKRQAVLIKVIEALLE